MEKNHLIQLTNELYRLTLLFPKKEPLRYKMRELADDILAKCLRQSAANNSVLEEFEILDSFFEVAKNQNWVSADELSKIQESYGKIGEELKTRPRSEEMAVVEATVGIEPQQDYETQPRNVERQQKILEILKEKGKAQVWELKKIFPEITKRTLRRDFRNLVKKGVIEKLGERNETYYQIKPL